jgi:hypothetical protein
VNPAEIATAAARRRVKGERNDAEMDRQRRFCRR